MARARTKPPGAPAPAPKGGKPPSTPSAGAGANSSRRRRRRSAVIVGLVGAAALYAITRGGRSSSTTAADDFAVPITPAPAGSLADFGAGSANGGFDPSFLDSFGATIERLDNLESVILDVGGEASDAADAAASAAAGVRGLSTDVQDLASGVIASRESPPNDDGPSGQVPPPAPGNRTASGFWWNIGGKRTFVTTKNKAAFLQELRRDGANLDVWAAKHQPAARSIGITPPPKPPPAKPKPAPKKKK